jgi:hypothetical protein
MKAHGQDQLRNKTSCYKNWLNCFEVRVFRYKFTNFLKNSSVWEKVLLKNCVLNFPLQKILYTHVRSPRQNARGFDKFENYFLFRPFLRPMHYNTKHWFTTRSGTLYITLLFIGIGYSNTINSKQGQLLAKVGSNASKWEFSTQCLETSCEFYGRGSYSKLSTRFSYLHQPYKLVLGLHDKYLGSPMVFGHHFLCRPILQPLERKRTSFSPIVMILYVFMFVGAW